MSAPYGQPRPGPAGGTSPELAAATPPAPVRRAVLAAYAIAVLSLIGMVVSIATYHPSAATSGDGALSDGAQQGLATASAVVGGIVGAALWALFAWFASKGRNWARIVLVVLSVLAGLASLISIFRFRASSIVSLVELVLVVLVLVGLLVRPASEWFAARKAQQVGRGYGYGGPGGPQDPGYPPVPPVQ